MEQQLLLLVDSYLPYSSSNELPVDWDAVSLSTIADFIGGYSYKSTELVKSDIAMATIKNFERNGGFKLDGFKEIVPSGKLKSTQIVEMFDILVAHTDLTQKAEVAGNAEMVLNTADYKQLIMSMDLVKVVPKTNTLSRFLLAGILKHQRFKQHCLGYVNGSTVLHLSKAALPEYVLYLPHNLASLQHLSETVETIYRSQANLIEENRRLISLRDSLLPKLMSGEIDVASVELSR